jgi:hypothetical protein
MVDCSKCGGQMHEGTVFISVDMPEVGMLRVEGMGMPGMGIPNMQIMAGENRTDTAKWREKTGQKTGLFRSGEKTMEISGHRCTRCGYIELYAIG